MDVSGVVFEVNLRTDGSSLKDWWRQEDRCFLYKSRQHREGGGFGEHQRQSSAGLHSSFRNDCIDTGPGNLSLWKTGGEKVLLNKCTGRR